LTEETVILSFSRATCTFFQRVDTKRTGEIVELPGHP